MSNDDEIKRLQEENQRLGEQVKQLVRMERRLHDTQRDLEQQVQQVSALSDFSLKAVTSSDIVEVVCEALDFLVQLYPFHRALAVVSEQADQSVVRIDHRPRADFHQSQSMEWESGLQLVEKLEPEPLFFERAELQQLEQSSTVRGVMDQMAPGDGGYRDWHSALILPLVTSSSNLFGCLWAINCTDTLTDHELGFGASERPMIEVFRRHLVAAIENMSLNYRLEQRVRQRTRELASANQNLEQVNEQLQHEMSERIEAERTLARVQKLESLGQLTASLGHEINNPLTYVLANLQFIDRRFDDDDFSGGSGVSAEVRGALGDAIEGGERIAQLVRDIKGFAGDYDVSLKAIDLREVIEGAVKLAGKRIRHVAKLDCVVPDDELMVEADAGLVEQVLINVLLNAAEAIPEDDGDDHCVTIEAGAGDDGVELVVRDTGVGIGDDELDRIFDPFFSTKISEGGTGLGLYVCHMLMESMHGSIDVDSTPGEGTDVRIGLRRATDGDVDSDSDRLRSDVDLDERLRILIIDDERSILRSLKRMLEGHDIEAFSDSRQALEAYREQPFDVVLCDLMMPGLSGRDVYERLAAMGRSHAARVLFITGGAFTDAERHFLDSVPNQCLEKPVSKIELEALLASDDHQLSEK